MGLYLVKRTFELSGVEDSTIIGIYSSKKAAKEAVKNAAEYIAMVWGRKILTELKIDGPFKLNESTETGYIPKSDE
jgi:hypothetical protein